MKYLIALDAGTTSVRAFVYDLSEKKFVFRAQQEVGQNFPHPGWVEQDANEIYFKAAYVLNACARFAGDELAGVGVTNQRETVVLWDGVSGDPVCPAIGWQCRRTAAWCEALDKETVELIHAHTGLVPDAYFSASKIRWALDHVPAVQASLKAGRLRVGTVDSYLIWKLTQGKSFVTDVTNASRTMLYNIRDLSWDAALLDRFEIPAGILPEVRASDARMGEVTIGHRTVPLAGLAGDQQAALVGQACFASGTGKITYGTGLFLLFNTGAQCVSSRGLLSTIGYSVGGRTVYALEGSMFHAGSGVQWLRDGLGMISTAAESELLATSVPSTDGVYFVPAFTGLGAPYWAPEARALLTGVTRGTTKAHIVRAVLESIAYGARDLTDCMQQDSGLTLSGVRCDGGASANNFLMQFQADVLGVAVDRPAERESTALGAAMLCALSLGLTDEQELPSFRAAGQVFSPDPARRGLCEQGYAGYRDAVRRALLK